MRDETITKKLFDLDIAQRKKAIECAKKVLCVFKENDGKRFDKRIADKVKAIAGLDLTKEKHWSGNNEWTLRYYPTERSVSGEPDSMGVCLAHYIAWHQMDFFWALRSDTIKYEELSDLIEKRIAYEEKSIDELKFAWKGRERMRKERADLVQRAQAFNEKWRNPSACKYLGVSRETLYR